MKTPICDFVEHYMASGTSRFHMPGHKGKPLLGMENLDITEIDGADVLYSANGIIEESEDLTSSLFRSAHTFYSTEGSTLSIKGMLALIKMKTGGTPLVLAARNVHKAFIYGISLLGMDVSWLMPKESTSLCSCPVTAKDVEDYMLHHERKPDAVYLTSPDYLGQIQDIAGISKVCKSYGIPLLVDNAHGAYLAFLESSMHPLALGATMCADSAHKTLPVLTGGSYLHIAKDADSFYTENARRALSLFASTSPSYLILQSLDKAKSYLADGYKEKLSNTVCRVEKLKEEITGLGYALIDGEPLKVVFDTLEYGYSGEEFASYLRQNGMEIEFADCDRAVLMVTEQNPESDYEKLLSALAKLPKKAAIHKTLPHMTLPETVMKTRDAMLSPFETVDVKNSLGKIAASPLVSCPPAVPIIMSGEKITKACIDVLTYYGTEKIDVVK